MIHIKYSFISLVALLVISIKVSAATFYTDGFESDNLSTTNSDGFDWAAPNATSIVTGGPGANSQVFPSAITVNDSRDWTAKTGTKSLRFRYPAGGEWSEQRFNLGQPRTELWLSYWVRVPTNYAHTNTDGDAANNKFLALWMDGYEADGVGSTVWLSMEQSGSNSNLAFTYSLGSNTGSLGMQQHTAFINSSTDKGRWMHIVFHVKSETSNGADDGIIQTWRKWSNESSYTQLHNGTGLGIKIATSPAGFENGYFMGWANGAYAVDTEWLIDDVTFSTTDLRESSGAVNGVCGSNDGATLSSLTSGNSSNCSAGTVSGFVGTGPWTWDCAGSGGGSTDEDCTASLQAAVPGGMKVSAGSMRSVTGAMRVIPAQ